MTSIKGKESTPYEALLVIAGLLFNFTIVKMRGPNKYDLKTLNLKIFIYVKNIFKYCKY